MVIAATAIGLALELPALNYRSRHRGTPGLDVGRLEHGCLTFWQTKNGKVRRIPITDTIAALLAARPRIHSWVFTNARTEKPYTTI